MSAAVPEFFTHSQQPNTATQAVFTEQWTRLLLAYARHRRLFTLRLEDAEVPGGEWDEVLRNPRINSGFISSTYGVDEKNEIR